ncbi:MAG: type II toxin-antitoxin system VapB family antitoxin [Planctomycetaceae bacterium]
MLLCMRTTLDLSDSLLQRAKELAARTGRPLREIVEDALRESLSRESQVSSGKRVRLPVSTQAPGLCPGVDLDHTSSLLDLMEAGKS